MTLDSIWILAVLGLNVAVSEWLVRRTWLRHLGSALVVIVLTALVANLGLIPTYSSEIGIYRAVFDFLAPLAIFLLLLKVHLRGLMRAGGPLILLFLIGSAGTAIGVLVGIRLVGGGEAFGEHFAGLAGMFVATYTGGSINFSAVALAHGVVNDGPLFTGAAAVDSAATTVWMAATVGLPRLLRPIWPVARTVAKRPGENSSPAPEFADEEPMGAFDLALLTALGTAAIWISERSAGLLSNWTGRDVPSILILTTLALVLAQLPWIRRIRGASVLGWVAVMFFLAVIGALCDVSSLAGLGTLGFRLVLFVTAAVVIHGAIVFGAAAVLGTDLDAAAVASQANVGGGTSALALARSLGRPDLVLPAVLIGSLGNALGTYLGLLTAGLLE